MEQVAVIYNPVAGRGKALQLAKSVESQLLATGASVQVLATRAAGDGKELAMGLSPDVQRIFVVGGDGTLREVAGGVLESGSGAALGHIPLGNANVVARELGVPLDPEAAIPALLNGQPESFDVLEVNGQLVLAMVGVGYDAQLAASMQKARSGFGRKWYRLHGDSLYGVVGACCLLKPELRRFDVMADGEVLYTDFTGCIVSNMRTYAKGWAPNPEADPQDGLMNYSALKPGPFPTTLLSLLAAASQRSLPAKLATRGTAQDMLIAASNPFHWQADGDAMGLTSELRIHLRPKCLRLIVPMQKARASLGASESTHEEPTVVQPKADSVLPAINNLPKLYSAGYCPICWDTGTLLCVWSLSGEEVFLFCPTCEACWRNKPENNGESEWFSLHRIAPGGIRLPTVLEVQDCGFDPGEQPDPEEWWPDIVDHLVDPEVR